MLLEDYQKKVKCPIHECLIGKYDSRIGITNTTFYCPKCKKEYTFTIRAQKKEKSVKILTNKKRL
ncbi:MAG: hypothetical protein HPY96_00680 [Bacilli bacterium]|nr:hypothetical protein [Bacilli bacterium]